MGEDQPHRFAAARLALAQTLAAKTRTAPILMALAEAAWDCGEHALFLESFNASYRLRPGAERFDFSRGCERVLAQCNALIVSGIHYAGVLAAKARCELTLSRPESAHWRLYAEPFLHQGEVQPPDGLTRPEFHDLLMAEARRHAVRFGETRNSLHNAWRDDRFIQRPSDARDLFLRAVGPHIENYLARLPQKPDNPFLAARPAEFALHGWAIIAGAEGKANSHLHGHSWVNGIYYVAAPETVRREKPKGWLIVEPPAPGLPAGGSWQDLLIEPTPGSLVMMPSHFRHRTAPTGSDQERICIVVELQFPELRHTGRDE